MMTAIVIYTKLYNSAWNCRAAVKWKTPLNHLNGSVDINRYMYFKCVAKNRLINR